jgi:glutamine amidotransferase
MFIPACRVTGVQTLEQVERIVLPGVGSFDGAITRLRSMPYFGELVERVVEDRVPVLGVCVGFQMMMERSEEGSSEGLGWIPGEVTLLEAHESGRMAPLPHMGWNDVVVKSASPLLSGLDESRFYFLHSYRVVPTDDSAVIATTAYGDRFVSVASRDNVYGTQFHPEKSHHWGFSLLRNFAELTPC